MKIVTDEDACLLGSSVHLSTIQIRGKDHTLGFFVSHAYDQSGLSVEEWNALPEHEMEMNIQLAITWHKLNPET